MSLRRETARDADSAGLGYARRMNRLLPLIFALAGLVLALSPAVARAQAHADPILVDGTVWTGNPGQPEAEAIAILDGKVAQVRHDIEVRSWAGPAPEVLELGSEERRERGCQYGWIQGFAA